MSVKKDLVWSGLDIGVSQGLAFLFRMALAKILAPEQFGIVAITVATTMILQVINDFGLTATLIQRPDEKLSERVVISCFTASVGITLLLFSGSIFIVAPLAAEFFRRPEVASLAAVSSISLLFTPFSSTSRALLYRQLRFKSYTIVRFVSMFASLITGFAVLLIFRNVWAFAVQLILGQAFLSIGLLRVSDWSPRIRFDKESFREIFSYSSLVFANDVIRVLLGNLDVIVIGRILTSADVGVYATALYLTQTARTAMWSVLDRVMFVHYAKAQTEDATLRAQYLRTAQWNCKLLFPLMVTVAFFGTNVAVHLLGPGWTSIGSTLQLLSVAVMIDAFGGTTTTLYKATGRPGIDLILTVLTQGVVRVPALIFGAYAGGIQGVALGNVLAKLFAAIVRQVLLDKVIGSTLRRTIQIVGTNLLYLAPVGLVWLAGSVGWSNGGWVRDIILGTIVLVFYEGRIVMEQLPLLKRQLGMTGGRTV